jgi:hypothetical protein
MVGPVRWNFPLIAGAVLSAVVALVGCGGDDSDAGDYRDEASAMCSEAIREAEGISPPANRSDLDRLLRETLKLSRDYNRRLASLEPPAELAERHARSQRLNLRAERLTEKLLDDIAAGEALEEVLPGYTRELVAISRRSNKLARSMGLPDCVVPVTGPGEPAAPA